MRLSPITRAGVLCGALAFVCCGGGSSSDDVASCMEAMSQVICPPGTAPRSESAGASSLDVEANLIRVGAANAQDIGCNLHCAPICQCGIARVEGDGGVVCTPCGATAGQVVDVLVSPDGGSGVPGVVNPQPVVRPPPQGAPRVQLDFTSPPLFEHHHLTAPFRPDPFQVTIRAGGNDPIADAGIFDPTGGACTGFVNAAQPDIVITYSSRGTPLLMSVNSDSDTTLIVNAPDGTWRCNDDATESTLNPRIYFRDGMSGRYSVWVGTYTQDSSFPLANFRTTTHL